MSYYDMVYVRKKGETNNQAIERWRSDHDRQNKLKAKQEKSRRRRERWHRLWRWIWKIAAKVFWIVATAIIVWIVDRLLTQHVR